MENNRPDRPEWMNDEQYAIYCEVRRILDGMCAALTERNWDTWQERTIRLREMSRFAHEKMFAEEPCAGGSGKDMPRKTTTLRTSAAEWPRTRQRLRAATLNGHDCGSRQPTTSDQQPKKVNPWRS